MSYEVRVWHEAGDCMGVAEVTQDGQLWAVTVTDAEPDSGYAWPVTHHSTKQLAEMYAKGWADDYLNWLDDNCSDCQRFMESGCGVLSDHGYSIQYCRDGWSAESFG